MLSRVGEAKQSVYKGFGEFKLHLATAELQRIFLGTFCDQFIEYAKSNDLYDAECTYDVLLYSLKNFLILFNPSMPFITEEIYSWLPRYNILHLVI